MLWGMMSSLKGFIMTPSSWLCTELPENKLQFSTSELRDPYLGWTIVHPFL